MLRKSWESAPAEWRFFERVLVEGAIIILDGDRIEGVVLDCDIIRVKSESKESIGHRILQPEGIRKAQNRSDHHNRNISHSIQQHEKKQKYESEIMKEERRKHLASG
jgi:hypothetical protein